MLMKINSIVLFLLLTLFHLGCKKNQKKNSNFEKTYGDVYEDKTKLKLIH